MTIVFGFWYHIVGTTSESTIMLFLRSTRSLFLGRLFHRNLNLPSRVIHPEGAKTPLSYKARRESLLTPTILLVASIPVFTFVLGTWQLQRLHWKVALIEELEEKLQSEPLSLPKQVKYFILLRYPFPLSNGSIQIVSLPSRSSFIAKSF